MRNSEFEVNRPTQKGIFVVLEGLDNSGKTTQQQKLKDFCESIGWPVKVSREPGGTELGEELRTLLLRQRHPQPEIPPMAQALMFYAARQAFLEQVIKPNIDQGISVIADRFAASTFAYQGYAQGVNKALLQSLYRKIVSKSGYRPDLTVILDIPAAVSIARQENEDNIGQKLVFEDKGLVFAEKLRQGYLHFAGSHMAMAENTHVIDGQQSVDDIHQQIKRLTVQTKGRKI